ncbi:hypothetical protein Vadar_029772 [Vaccinium darrowii]|jgi:gas vesicle protein|uniref:Uncharacterized protein n=1 Tax=Vaccinium darrowii TaxID=229202 RepID=A0ACB7XM28_9ERIC|nr:hypothetical protein Vadar_029772 [Vaccinium darrowii]
MATSSIASVSIPGGSLLKSHELWSSKSNSLRNSPRLTRQRKSNQPQITNLSIRAKYNDRTGGEGDFVAGFLLGGALFGSAAYIFAPKIRKALRNEGDNGFLKPKGPMYEGYYDHDEGGLEKTRHTLNEKIGQLNSAIDNVYSRLRGVKKMPPIPVESDADELIA